MNVDPSVKAIDMVIHGRVHIRLLGASSKLLKRLELHYGARMATAGRNPDILLQFVPQVGSHYLHHVGQKYVAFDEKHFYLLDSQSGDPIMQLPMELVGEPCQLLCRQGLDRIPFLSDIIHTTFLTKGFIPLHASAVSYRGQGIIMLGWPKGGKTGAMLSFMNMGAEFCGDEWILISKDGHKIYGFPAPVTLSAWQLRYIPHLQPPISWRNRLYFTILDQLTTHGPALNRLPGWPSRPWQKLLPKLENQRRISRHPSTLFPGRIGDMTAELKTVFLLRSHNQANIRVTAAQSERLAAQIVQANMAEKQSFLALHSSFKYAFPERHNLLLEQFEQTQIKLLTRALSNRDLFVVDHPYGGPLHQLFEALSPYCVGETVSPKKE